MNFRSTIISLLLLIVFHTTQAQDEPLSVEEQLAKWEMEMDSLSIFMLIDSILSEESSAYSELNARFGYNSSVVSAGRNLGIDQHGLSPGISFYHKKGYYADLSGFWNSDFDPKYSLTVATLGYMKFIGKRWTLTGSYERWIYNRTSSESSSNSLKNSLNVSSGFTSKYFFASLDYNYLFGSEDAHRIIGNASGNLTLTNKWIFDKIRIAPSFSIIFGNRNVTSYFYSDEIERLQYIGEITTSDEFQSFLRTVDFSSEELQILRRINQNDNLDERTKRRRTNFIYSQNEEVQDYLDSKLNETSNEYGLMNYSFSLPIVFTIKRFNLILSYTYSIPVKLPKEEGNFDPVGYFGASIGYRIIMR
ncbi:MAG: hypothetical protein JXR03_05065 [Cyclobacteriaceae bacterium]